MAMHPTIPVTPTNDLAALLEGMASTGFQGRKLGESVRVWRAMLEDPDCTILLGLSGAMIPAGMREVLSALVRHHYVDAIVSTGANVFHDACEHLGVCHYQGHHHVDDADLFSRGIDRIYDVFAFEEEFRTTDRQIAAFAASVAPFRGSSRAFLEAFGRHIMAAAPDSRSFLATCVEEGVPVFVPALADSSIGIGLVIARRDGVAVDVDQLADADEITRIVEASAKTGVVYIGGGVPKNFIQQTQVIASIHDANLGGSRVRRPVHDRRPALGRALGLHLRGGDLLGQGAGREPARPVLLRCDHRAPHRRLGPDRERDRARGEAVRPVGAATLIPSAPPPNSAPFME